MFLLILFLFRFVVSQKQSKCQEIYRLQFTKLTLFQGVPILPLETLDILLFHSDLKILKKGKKQDINNLGDDQ